MSLANIMNLTANMTDPDKIIRNMDVTGYFGEFLIYGGFFVVLFALENRLDKFSKRLAVASMICFVPAVMFYAVDFLSRPALLRIILGLIVSMIYLFVETTKESLYG